MTTCAIQSSNDGVVLHIKHQPAIEYMDIASALGQFLIDEVTEDMIWGIQVKLESSLDRLERFGYSIDRLRINPPQPTDGK